MELIFTTAYCLSSASQIKMFSLTASLNEIQYQYRYNGIAFLEYRNTGIAEQRRYWRP